MSLWIPKTTSFWFPGERSPTRGPLHGASWESNTLPPEPLHPPLKVPSRRALLQVSQKRSPYKEMPIPRAFSKCPSGSPAREPPWRETLHPQCPFSYILKSCRWAHSRLPKEPPQREVPIPRAFLSKPSGSSTKESPPPGSPKRSSHRERCPVCRAPFQLSLRVSGEQTHPSPEPSFLCSSESPKKMGPPPEQSSHKERCSLSRALHLFTHLYLWESPIRSPPMKITYHTSLKGIMSFPSICRMVWHMHGAMYCVASIRFMYSSVARCVIALTSLY